MTSEPQIFPNSLDRLLESCVSFYTKNKDQMSRERILERRASLSDSVRVFHEESGTLTSMVQGKIEKLRDGKGLVLMTAHQPNLFAYSGVLRKATLNFVLGKKLEELLEIPVISFFGIADQDFTNDRWVGLCQVPSVRRSGGVLPISLKLPENIMLNRVTKPSFDVLERWKAELEKWVDEAVDSVYRLCSALGLSGACSSLSVQPYRKNLDSFWSIVEDCHKRSKNYSDFNAFLMSRIVNEVWGYDTVFSRFSECQQAFGDEFSFLLSHFDDYSRSLREALETRHVQNMGGEGVTDKEPLLAPFWYHCTCGSKARLFMFEQEGLLRGRGECSGCKESHELLFGSKDEPNVSNIRSRISARAIAMCLIFFRGIMPSCYVGGLGGAEYLRIAQHVTDELKIGFPAVAVWRPHDKYMGIGQVEASLETKRICSRLAVPDISEAKKLLESRLSEAHERLDALEESKKEVLEKLKVDPNNKELKEEAKTISICRTKIAKSSDLSVTNSELRTIENAAHVLDLVPSILDYAVSIGLKETSEQWINHLNKNGDLSSDILVESSFSRNNPNFEITLLNADRLP